LPHAARYQCFLSSLATPTNRPCEFHETRTTTTKTTAATTTTTDKSCRCKGGTNFQGKHPDSLCELNCECAPVLIYYVTSNPLFVDEPRFHDKKMNKQGPAIRLENCVRQTCETKAHAKLESANICYGHLRQMSGVQALQFLLLLLLLLFLLLLLVSLLLLLLPLLLLVLLVLCRCSHCDHQGILMASRTCQRQHYCCCCWFPFTWLNYHLALCVMSAVVLLSSACCSEQQQRAK
jgi:hypothetical protein